MSKTLSKYIHALDYAGKTVPVLSAACSGASICSFTTVMGIPLGISSASVSLVFLISNGTVKMILKRMARKKTNTELGCKLGFK